MDQVIGQFNLNRLKRESWFPYGLNGHLLLIR